MKVVVAIDSFKGSLSTFEAGNAVADGVHRVYPDADVVVSPLADGGEGTVEAITAGANGRIVNVTVTGPLGEETEALYGIINGGRTAVIEMASAAGITLVDADQRNPLYTTTYGVGEIINDAISKGCRQFIVGIGGSATNDGGVGMLQALGFEFMDVAGNDIQHGAMGLMNLARINADGVNPALKECSFCVACDVRNVLCGEDGCSAVYGPQKGATPEMIAVMDRWLSKYAELTKTVNPDSDMNYPGSGAAGGMGFAFLSYLGGELRSGIDIVIDSTGLEEKIADADIVVTGEGRLDGQSCMGKAPVGVAKLGKKHGKTVVAFSGCVTDDADICNEHGIDAFFPILKAPCTLEEAMNTRSAYSNLADTARQVFGLIKQIKEVDKK